MRKLSRYVPLASIITLLLICVPVMSHAFSSEAEIDAYYDAQLEDTRNYYDNQRSEVNQWLEDELDRIEKKTEEGKWELYRKTFGKDFEMVKPFLPESNPNPNEHAYYMSLLSEQDARNAIRNIMAINPVLGKDVLFIYESKYLQVNKTESNPVQVENTNTLKSNTVNTISATKITPVSNTNTNIEKDSIDELREQIKEELKNEIREEVEGEKNKESKTEEEPKSVFKRIGGFFKKLMFWR